VVCVYQPTQVLVGQKLWCVCANDIKALFVFCVFFVCEKYNLVTNGSLGAAYKIQINELKLVKL